MTPQQWQEVADQLALPWGSARLYCDGYELTMQVAPVAPLRYVIRVYVGGRIEGRWLTQECEERRRFLRPVQIPLYTPTDKKKLLAGIKRPSQAFRDSLGLDKKVTVYRPDWKSFRALKAHLLAHNTDIVSVPAPAAAEVA